MAQEQAARQRERRNAAPLESGGLDFWVVSGVDTGSCFRLDAPVVEIGRAPVAGEASRGSIRLRDATISLRQATLYRDGGAVILEHHPEATVATLLNGRPTRRAPVRVGDLVAFGSVVAELRERAGVARERRRPPTSAAIQDDIDDPNETTQLRVVVYEPESKGTLRVVRGQDAARGDSFAIRAQTTTIGRAPGSDVELADRAVSRKHAELEWRAGELHFVQTSALNVSFVNGLRVVDSIVLRDGDEIQIADAVVLCVENLRGAPARAGEPADLRSAMEEKLRLEQQIEQRFLRSGSMLDVDVAGASELKSHGVPPAHVILSFERFRAYVSRTVVEFSGAILNSNGDEIMCFFEDTLQAVRAGSALLERLASFNRSENLLPSPFRFRIGIHTGTCLVDLERGRAFSPLLDVAGHLQKAAETNGLLLSQDTYDALPAGLPLEPAGTLERHALRAYRLAAWVH